MEDIAEDVWGFTGEIRMPAGVRFPLRMTGIRLPDGSMWLHSPVAIDDAMAWQIERLGPVQHLVAPSLIHNVHVAAARSRWPRARLYAAPGLRAKLPGLPIDEDLGASAPASWGGAVATFPIRGAATHEVVFLHRPSRTLLVTDLAFNVVEPANVQTSAMLWITGSHGRFRSSKLWAWRWTQDRGAVADSVRRVLEQDFDRVVPCHGAIVDRDAEAALADATQPLLTR